jgi:hypothetical protein
LTNGFRIFTNHRVPTTDEDIEPPVRQPPPRELPLTISFARATTKGGEEDASAGAGVWLEDASPANTAIKIPSALGQSRANAEVIAAVIAVDTTALDMELRLENPRSGVMSAMTKGLDKWEDRGWIGVANKVPLQALATGLCERTAKTTFAISKSTPGSTAAADLAKNGSLMTQEDSVHLPVPPGKCLQGAKLSSMTQSLAYKGIKALRKPVSRVKTDANIKAVQEAVKEEFSFHPKSPAIWKSIRHKDIGRNIRNFLWKSLHGTHRIGTYPQKPRRRFRGPCSTTRTS